MSADLRILPLQRELSVQDACSWLYPWRYSSDYPLALLRAAVRLTSAGRL